MTKRIGSSPFVYTDDGAKVLSVANPDGSTSEVVPSFAKASDIPTGFAGTARVGTDLYVGNGIITVRQSTQAVDAFVGQVATNCRINRSVTAGAWKTDQRTVHVATENLSMIKPIHANWYSFGGQDSNSGNAITIECSVEYPAGTVTRVTYSGSNVGTIADGANSNPDWCFVNIPKGAVFGIRTYTNCPSNLAGSTCLFASFGGLITEGATNNTTSTPNNVMTPGTGVSYNPGGVALYPCAIVAYTTNQSFLLAGDSITQGAGYDTPDSQLKIGMYERSLTQYGHINIGLGGESVAFPAFGTRWAKRGALAQYCTNVHISYGTNDFVGGSTAAAILSATNTFLSNYANNKRISVSTIIPFATGTFVSSGGTGQTSNANESVKVAYNNLLFAGGITQPHYIVDPCTILADSYSSPFWKGAATPYTSDGTHPNQKGCIYAATLLRMPIGQ